MDYICRYKTAIYLCKTIKEKTQVFEKNKVRYMGKFEGRK